MKNILGTLRPAAAFMVLLTFLSAVTACSSGISGTGDTGTDEKQSGASPQASQQSATAAASSTAAPPDIAAKDGGGKDFVFISREVTNSYVFPYNEIYAEEQNGEPLNDAVYKRNLAVSEKYNIKIVSVKVGDVSAQTLKAVQAGDDVYDVSFPMTGTAMQLAVSGAIADLSDIPHIDTSKPWWMSNVLGYTSIGKRNFFIPGDINLSALDTVGITYFNKKMAGEYKLGNIYDTVKKGAWTLDKFTEYCRNVTKDLNGDGVFNGQDMFGFTCNAFVWQPFFYGTGSMVIEKDKSDMPYLALGTDHNITVLQKLVGFLNDRTSTILVNQFPELQTSTGWGQASIDMFSGDRALFWVEIIYGVPQLRNMDTDFGILPMPKYDESQENYVSYIHASHSSVTTVPVTNTDLDFTGRVLEDMAYQSYITVRPAFYDTMLKSKYARDSESAEMLDIIYKHIVIDLVHVIPGLSIDTTMRNAMINNDTGIASSVAALESASSSAIQKCADSITGTLKK